MASVNRKSLSLTDVARFNRRFKGYGFAEDAKVKRSFMLTPFDLSECVGPSDSSYPKEPLGPQPGPFEPSIKWSVTALGRHKHGPRKASSATVLTSHQKLSGKRMPLKKTCLTEKSQKTLGNQDKDAKRSDNCVKSKVDSTDKMLKDRRSRIPVPIKALTASKSATEITHIVDEKTTVVKRHFSSPNLGKNLSSKIPVRVNKINRKYSTEKTTAKDDVQEETVKFIEAENKSVNSTTIPALTEKSVGNILPDGNGMKTDESLVSGIFPEKGHQKRSASRNDPQPANKAQFIVKATGPHNMTLSNENELKMNTYYHESSFLVVNFETDSGEENKNDSSINSAQREEKLHFTDVTRDCGSESNNQQMPNVPLIFDNDSSSNVKAETEKENGSNENSFQIAEKKLHHPTKVAELSFLVTENKPPKGKELFVGTTSCNDSSVLVVTFETDSGEETKKEKDFSDKVPETKMISHHTDVTKEDDNETTCLQSLMKPLAFNEDSNSNVTNVTEKKKDFESEEKSHQPDVSSAAEMCGPIACYHQSSILLLTCETDCSSDSAAESDRTKTSSVKLPQIEDFKSAKCDFIVSKDSVSSKQEPKMEKDSGIALSRVTMISNQSSLLVLSHDTSCTSDCSIDDELLQVSGRNAGTQRERNYDSDNDLKSKNERSQRGLNNTNEKIKHEPTVCTDNHSSDYSLREESRSSAGSSATTQTEMSEDSREKKYSLTDNEFLRLAKLLNTTVPPQLNLKESGVQKEKIRRCKRTQQQLARKALGTSVLSQRTADQVSYSLSSSDEDENELPHNEGTREGVTELRSYKEENILLRGQLERLKQINSTLRFNERTLLKKAEDQSTKTEFLNSKSSRLRAQVKTLKRELKKNGVKSRQQKNALRKDLEHLHQKLLSADKLASTLKSCLQESDNFVALQKMELLEVDKAMSAERVKLQQLEDKFAEQQGELQRAAMLVSRQDAELQRANEEIEKQKAELRVADEETVKQLENIQCTFSVLKERERVLIDTMELSKKRVANLEEQITSEAQKTIKIVEELQTERNNNNIAFQEQITDLQNQLQAGRELEERTARLERDLELRNQQLSNENKQLREEVRSTNLPFVGAESELQKVLIARNTLCKQLEEKVTSLENQKSELQRLNAQLTSDSNTPKREESTQTLASIIPQPQTEFCNGVSGLSKNNSDVDRETIPDVEQLNSEFYSPNISACAKSNERNASRFLWLMRECAQLRELLRKLETEHCSLVEKTDEEKEMMRSEIDRLSKESLRKDKELNMMESSLEELGKVKNYEIRDLKQALRRRDEECAMIKEELRQKEDKTKIITATQTKRKWFAGRQQ